MTCLKCVRVFDVKMVSLRAESTGHACNGCPFQPKRRRSLRCITSRPRRRGHARYAAGFFPQSGCCSAPKQSGGGIGGSAAAARFVDPSNWRLLPDELLPAALQDSAAASPPAFGASQA